MDLSLRMTLIGNLPTPQEVASRLQKLQNITRVLVSFEEATRYHYHIILTFSDVFQSRSKDADRLRKWIKEEFKLEGNKSYSLTFVKKLQSAISYTLKDGSYFQHGFNQEEIEVLRRMSYQTGNSNFKDELDILEKWYMEQKSDDLIQLAKKFVDLKIRYNQIPTNQSVERILTLYSMKKYPNYRDEFAVQCVSNYFRKLGRYSDL